MNIKTSHKFPVNVETFWGKIYFDIEYNTVLYKEHIHAKAYETMEYEETDSEIRRKIRVVPEQTVPSFAKKLIREEFSYVEEGTFDKKEKVYRFKIVPSTMEDKIKISGTVTTEPVGDKAVERIVDLNLKADIFAIGGQIEKFIGEQIKKGYDASYQFTLDWIQRRNLG